MNYKGSCHCGKIKFEVEGEIKNALACNCSICSKKASLLSFFPRENLKLLTPDSNLSTYTFNKHVIQHRFCNTCGIHPFAEAKDLKGHLTAAVNIRCLDDFDFSAVPVQHYDGRKI